MKKPGYILLLLCLLASLAPHARAQVKVVAYYEAPGPGKLIKEEYYVQDTLNGTLQGPYLAYFNNGQIKIRGYYQANQPTGIWEYYWENGKLKSRGQVSQQRNQGPWEYYYEQGGLRSRGMFDQGQKQGRWSTFYENGELKSQGQYLNNQRSGLWNYYHPDGTLKAQAYYQQGRGPYQEFYMDGRLKAEGLNVNNKSDSLWTWYYEDGQVKEKGYYKEGIKNGAWTTYHPNGQVASKGQYQNGQPQGKWVYYHENGRVNAEGALRQGQRQGYWKLYYDNGAFKGEGVFTQGTGTYSEYYESGKLKMQGKLENGKNQGPWKYYYESGQLEGLANFKNGNGLYRGFYQDSTLKMQGTLVDGIRTGKWELYDRQGKLAGYLRPIYEETAPVYRLPENPIALTEEDSLAQYEKPNYLYKKRQGRFYRPQVNEFRAVIASLNPLSMPLGSIHFYAEYYMEERLGVELQYSVLRDPFFTSDSRVALNAMYSRGYGFRIRQKLYSKDRPYGMLYFAQELGYVDIVHAANTIDSLGGQPIQRTLDANERRAELSFLIGDRFTFKSDDSGFTMDFYVGLGIGYRWYTPNFATTEQNQALFASVPKEDIHFPVRFGFSFGYVFSTRKSQLGK